MRQQRMAHWSCLLSAAALLSGCGKALSNQTYSACRTDGKFFEGPSVVSEGYLLEDPTPDIRTFRKIVDALSSEGFQYIEVATKSFSPALDKLSLKGQSDLSRLKGATYVRFYLAPAGSQSCKGLGGALDLYAANQFISKNYIDTPPPYPRELCLAAEPDNVAISPYVVLEGRKHIAENGVEGERRGVFRREGAPVFELVSFLQPISRHDTASCFDQGQPLFGVKVPDLYSKIASARTGAFAGRLRSSVVDEYYRQQPYATRFRPPINSAPEDVVAKEIEPESVRVTDLNEELDLLSFVERYRNPAETMAGMAIPTLCPGAKGWEPCIVLRRDGQLTGVPLPLANYQNDTPGVQWIGQDGESLTAIGGLMYGNLAKHQIEVWRISPEGRLEGHFYVPVPGIPARGALIKRLESVKHSSGRYEVDYLEYGNSDSLGDTFWTNKLHGRISVTFSIPGAG